MSTLKSDVFKGEVTVMVVTQCIQDLNEGVLHTLEAITAAYSPTYMHSQAKSANLVLSSNRDMISRFLVLFLRKSTGVLRTVCVVVA